ncbi:uncharacterized protein PV09_06625 [Verruconis gallopava]|uniref:Large ribosomal subunit protein mL46 n=1 Tax=Verruconis gallopava TaxID=253628 RepID=A0A0D2ASJ1_9PEZI|nr:uncharacterized protein PV09_06625 [Verruconis gallopava]KIW02139.1 hypothetical protein PV09_06625 [Verruconis gallopava]
MKGSRHGIKSLIGGNGIPRNGPVCSSCRNHVLQARRASTAAAVAPSEDATTPKAAPPRQSYQIRAGVVLSRPPQITRDLTPFEKAFFLYQRRLNERLSLPAMQYFYFRPNSPAMLDFKRKRRARGGVAARDIGAYNPYDKTAGWNDELLMGDPICEPEHQAKELIKDSIPLPKDDETVDGEAGVSQQQDTVLTLMPRWTEADEKGDQRSLNRLLQRTLYLLVRNKQGQWTFPEDVLVGRESLAMAAERILTQSGGVNMNTFIVGNHPVGHRVVEYQALAAEPNQKKGAKEAQEESAKQKKELQELRAKYSALVAAGNMGEKLFFMKARIMAGQFDLAATQMGITDFKWLSKEEVEKQVDSSYWSSIKNMLPTR